MLLCITQLNWQPMLYFIGLNYDAWIIRLLVGQKITAFISALWSTIQDWTGLNFESIMEEADKIKNTVWNMILTHNHSSSIDLLHTYI